MNVFVLAFPVPETFQMCFGPWTWIRHSLGNRYMLNAPILARTNTCKENEKFKWYSIAYILVASTAFQFCYNDMIFYPVKKRHDPVGCSPMFPASALYGLRWKALRVWAFDLYWRSLRKQCSLGRTFQSLSGTSSASSRLCPLPNWMQECLWMKTNCSLS